MEYLFAIAWWAAGYASFVYWWTTQHDLKVEDAICGMFYAVIGPLAFVLGWLIHGKPVEASRRILMAKRESK